MTDFPVGYINEGVFQLGIVIFVTPYSFVGFKVYFVKITN